MAAKFDRKDRLTPPLMHAFREAFRHKDAKKELDLRDDTGERIIASRRVSARSWVNEAAMRRDLAEDLTRLLNTVNLASTQDLTDHTYAERSIINYGLLDISAYSIDENAVGDITHKLRQSLVDYEPRLIASTIEVARDTSLDSSEDPLFGQRRDARHPGRHSRGVRRRTGAGKRQDAHLQAVAHAPRVPRPVQSRAAAAL